MCGCLHAEGGGDQGRGDTLAAVLRGDVELVHQPDPVHHRTAATCWSPRTPAASASAAVSTVPWACRVSEKASRVAAAIGLGFVELDEPQQRDPGRLTSTVCTPAAVGGDDREGPVRRAAVVGLLDLAAERVLGGVDAGEGHQRRRARHRRWRYRAHQPRGSAVLSGTAPQDGARPEGATTEHDQPAAEQRHGLYRGCRWSPVRGRQPPGAAVVGAAAAAVVVVAPRRRHRRRGRRAPGHRRRAGGHRAGHLRLVPAAACRGVVVMPKASAASGV